MKKWESYDAVVVGAGSAGLTTALNLAPLKVLVIKKDEENNSQYAQGGIAAAIDPGDSPELHFEDTLLASNLTADPKLAMILTQNGSEAIRFLKKIGVKFDRNNDQSLKLNREGSHSKARILRTQGDSIGMAIMKALTDAVTQAHHIDLLNKCIVKDLIINRDQVTGLIALRNNKWLTIETQRIILATGGAGQIFSRTTNHKQATGDGYAIAKRAKVTLNQMEMIQFHPTAFDSDQEQVPLISEALRGAGARLVTKYGEAIMDKVHPLKDLAPRDIVARTIWNQEHTVYLDATQVQEEFPTVKSICNEHGLNPRNDLIPISPAAHYFMGGIKCDQDGRTNLPGLWAIGECAGSGLHGANRLASNSLLECFVFGKKVAESSKSYSTEKIAVTPQKPMVYSLDSSEIEKIKKEIQKLMFSSLGIIRDQNHIEETLLKISTISSSISKCHETSNIKKLIELENIIECSKSICLAALANRHSSGAHYFKPRNYHENIITHSL